MAQISIIKKSDILKESSDLRFEAEFFLPKFLKQKNILANIKTLTLNECSSFTNGRAYDSDKISKNGDIFLSKIGDVTNKKDYHDWEKIEKEHFKAKKGKYLKHNDILMTLTGDPPDVGKVNLIYYPPKNKLSWNQRVALLRFKKQDFILSPELLFVILSSKYCKDYIERFAKGIRQRNVGNAPVRDMKIPILPQSFQLQIEKIVKTAYQKQTQSKQLYKEAEQLLLEELGLVNYKPKHQLTFTTTKKEIDEAKRFDAEYFQPKYKEIIEKIENYKGGFDVVKNVLKFNKKNFFPEENEFYNYLPLSKVSNSGEIEIPEKELGKNLPTRARRLVKKGEIVLSSISGSLETSALIKKEHENFIVSNGFYVFKSDLINSETLLILFKSKIMIQLLQRISKGAILGGYDLTAFEKTKIPLIKPQIQKQIAEKIQESHKLRKESKDLLKEAKRKVEEEIEK